MKKAMYVLGSISAFLLVAGLMFKFQHWPGASVMLVTGGVLFNLVFLPMYIAHKLKRA